ncbi:MAG: hypothetical protein MI724_04790, partial [Spirochaetales bacterium]|nr:hypothetical protein [Spirochaetales bacterium]
LDIYRFLEFQLTARTTNDLIYRYIEPLAEEVGLPERNPVEDLINSLRLFDEDAREESFFNLDSISFSAVHDLEDWELSATYTGRPELETENGISNYRWRGIFSILIRWRSISELRRTIEVEDGTVEFVQ